MPLVVWPSRGPRRSRSSRRLLSIVLALLAGGSAVVGSEAPTAAAVRTSYDVSAIYEVVLRLEWASRRVRVGTSIDVRNTSGGPIDRLDLNTVAARLGRLRLVLARVDGAPVAARVEDQTISLPLAAPLADGAQANVHVVYRARLRTTVGGRDYMWSTHGGVARLYRFIPWVSRRTPFGPTTNGEPWVTGVSPEVRITLYADRHLVWAPEGRRVPGPMGGVTYVASDVRDLTVAAGPGLHVTPGRSRDGDTRILVYTMHDDGHRWLDLARRALARFGKRLAPYPYPTLRIVEIDGPIAQESPGAAWIPTGKSLAIQRYLVTHEVAHQWFYALVGNDQLSDPFADEAMADFLTRDALGTFRSSRCSRDRLDRDVHAYTKACYYETIYVQGSRFLDELRRDFGDGGFWRALRRYVADNAYEVASTKRLLEAFRHEFGNGVLPRYRARFPSLYP